MPLPNIFKPKNNYSLIRIGRSNDGGYLLTEQSLKKTKALISFGIFDDCSFEFDFTKIKDVNSYCYDKSLVKSFWKKKLFNDLAASIYNFNFSFFIKSLARYYEHILFFKNNKNKLFIQKIDNGSVTKILNELNYLDSIFFKVDIEGSEYRILDELIKYQNSICGLVIEFHDLDLHLEKVVNFINNFNLTITHVHANNFGGVDINNNPRVIELTFEKNPLVVSGDLLIPNLLDQKNDPTAPEISLEFI